MKNLLVILSIFSFLFAITSCSESTTTEDETTLQDTINIEEKNTTSSALSNLKKSNFSLECDSLEYWFGGLQGVGNQKAACCYKMAYCNSPKFYDLIWAPENFVNFKQDMDNGELSTYFDETPEKELICYLFEVDKTENDNPQDEFDLYKYVYPSEVNVKIKSKGVWYNVDQQTVNTFEELGALKLETINAYNKSL